VCVFVYVGVCVWCVYLFLCVFVVCVWCVFVVCGGCGVCLGCVYGVCMFVRVRVVSMEVVLDCLCVFICVRFVCCV